MKTTILSRILFISMLSCVGLCELYGMEGDTRIFNTQYSDNNTPSAPSINPEAGFYNGFLRWFASNTPGSAMLNGIGTGIGGWLMQGVVTEFTGSKTLGFASNLFVRGLTYSMMRQRYNSVQNNQAEEDKKSSFYSKKTSLIFAATLSMGMWVATNVGINKIFVK